MPNLASMLDEFRPFRDSAGERVVREAVGWRALSIRETKDALFNFTFLDAADPDDAYALLSYIRHQIMTNSVAHAKNCLVRLRDFITAKPYERYDEHLPAILAWRTELRKRHLEWNLHYIRDWWLWSAEQGIEGFDDAETRWALGDIVIPGAPKGVAVLRQDPNEGPLFDAEEVAVRAALHRAGALLSLEERCLAWLFLSHGHNPLNVALLREEDYRRYQAGGEYFYELRVPRIKKRRKHRSAFKIRKLDPFLGELLHELIKQNAKRYSKTRSPRPLFWSQRPRSTAHHWADYANHLSSVQISKKLRSAFSELKIKSPIHGKRLRITPRRLRYSFASRLVRQGASVEELVDLLDHSDDQNVLIYFKNRDAQKSIDAAAAVSFGRIANRFMGRIAEDEREAGGNASNRIKTTVNLLDLGTCTLGAVCDKYPPRACYLCPKMIAWKTGAHERFLEETIAANRADPRETVQLDDVILAIGQVVAACKS